MPDEKKRKPPFSYRPPEARRAELEDLVAKSGLSFNAFITEAIFGRNRHRPAEIKLQARLLRECATFAEFIRRRDETEGDAEAKELLRSIKSLLIETRTALFILMGRKP